MPDLLAALQSALRDRYDVERELGAGGMAVVFLARDLKLNRRVAIKVLRPELSAAVGAERFLREITVAASLQHPHIVPVHDSGERDGLLYYVMAFVDGESLRDRLKRDGKLGAADALHLARGVSSALDYAHRRGVVHRDVKPENILLSDGEALVADFGIAKAVSAAGDQTLTQAGMALGTPAYMSPEQIAGDADVDGRSDIYSLGCVIYELLTGEPPFTGPTSQAVMAKRFTQTAPNLRRMTSSAPDAVVVALARAMSKRPEDRFATAAEFALALNSMAPTPPRAGAAMARSIAVLPFANMSTDPENEYFSDGISEEIINALTKIPTLRVAARTSAFAFKGKNEDVRVIGERLNVGAVLEGSVRRAGKRLRLTAQLIDVADGYHLWSETYERELDDVFAIQDDIARAIVGTLKVKLLGDPDQALVVKPTEHADAYALYLKGRYYWNRRTESALTKGLGCFEQAIAIDPGYALAHVGIADSYNMFGYYDLRPPREVFPLAHAAARTALAMDDSLAEAHAAEGYALMYYDLDWSGSERELRRAIELNPRYSIAPFYLGNLFVLRGRSDEGISAMRQGLELDPLSLIMTAAIGFCNYYAHRMEPAVAELRAALEMDDNFLIAHWWLGNTLAAMGRFDESTIELERAVVLSERSPTMLASLARVHALSGRREQAQPLLAELEALSEKRFVSSYEMAVLEEALGARERALALLEAAYEERSHSLAFLRMDPRLDPLRQEERFVRLLEKVGV